MTFKEKILRFNWALFLPMVALIAIGTVAIWSSGNAREALFHGMWKNHVSSAVFSLVIYFVLAFTDWRSLVRWWAPPAYVISLAMLIVVLFAGSEVYGGKRWLWFFQPSEIGKLCVLMFLAYLIMLWAEMREASSLLALEAADGDARAPGSFGVFTIAAAAAGIPALLILAEPDLGTTLALVPAVIVMLVAANIWRKGLFVLLAVGAVGASLVLGAVYEAEKPGQSAERREAILKLVPLKPHQIKRVKTFLFQDSDPMGAGYNARQALIAIASGSKHGRGIGKGETNRLKYLPPSVSMNDFIFCVWAEETGFDGCLALIALFAVLCSAGAWTAWRVKELEGRALALGITTLVFAHAYINIAMSVGMLPITGLPLPFISSGRTFLVTAVSGLGIVQSISIHNQETT